ncbi:ATP-binding protein [Antribacter gilvus]|uniref:ATP-binding protein n=1 Tax=Antribacter gilvus TaxID=2304675 RepID=UPI0019801CA6|nr:ATP-binding protein [Antribacter gilvus]
MTDASDVTDSSTMTLMEAAPPTTMAEVHSWTLGSVDDLTQMRNGLETWLARVPDEDAEHGVDAHRVVLVASELATNALRHGSPPVRVRLLSDGRAATVDVVDHRPETPPVLAAGRRPGAGGFGLQLARRAARDIGWFRAGNGEKHVWARFA